MKNRTYYRAGEGYFTSPHAPEEDWQEVNDCPHCDGGGCHTCQPLTATITAYAPSRIV